MGIEYIEIVHMDRSNMESIGRGGTRARLVINRIKGLEKTNKVVYIPPEEDDSIPRLPKSTPIRVGGATWGLCVVDRCDALKKAGYTNVVGDRSISLSSKDFLLDSIEKTS